MLVKSKGWGFSLMPISLMLVTELLASQSASSLLPQTPQVLVESEMATVSGGKAEDDEAELWEEMGLLLDWFCIIVGCDDRPDPPPQRAEAFVDLGRRFREHGLQPKIDSATRNEALAKLAVLHSFAQSTCMIEASGEVGATEIAASLEEIRDAISK